VKISIYYSIQNCGDGSAYPKFFHSDKLAELDQKYMIEGWGEPCTGSLTIKSQSTIEFEDEVLTKEDVIKELEEEIEEIKDYSDEDDLNRLQEHLKAVFAPLVIFTITS